MSAIRALVAPLAASSGLRSSLLVAGVLAAPASAQATQDPDLGVLENTGGFEVDTGRPGADGARCDLSLDVWTGSRAWSLDARLSVGRDDDGALVWDIVSLADPDAFTGDEPHALLLERVIDHQLTIVQDEVYLF